MKMDACLDRVVADMIRIGYLSRPFWPCWPSLIFILLCSGANFMTFSSDAVLAEALTGLDASTPEQYMQQGLRSFQRGALEQAIVSWLEAARLYERSAKPNEQSEALIYLSQAYQSVGQYKQALHSLTSALLLAQQSGDRTQIAAALGGLGNAYIATGPADQASRYLSESLAMAREGGNSGLSAVILNNLGNLFTSQKKYREAIGAYTESALLAQSTGNAALAARALTNEAKAALQHGQPQQSKELLDTAVDQIRGLDDSHDKAYGLISVGLTYSDLRLHLPDSHDLLLLLASNTFDAAVIVAQTVGDPRAASYAWGHLGQLYEAEHRYPEALQLTRRAIFAAQ
jgi:tetratricopeptide (TPR) repeat protein